MTDVEANQILGLALAAYPSQAGKLSSNAIAAMRVMWAELLEDINFAAAKMALKAYCRSAKFLPSVADIRELATSGPSGARSGIDAWGDVRRAVGRYGVYRTPRFDDPLVARAVEAVGWLAICASENEAVERAHFAKAYDRFAADARTTAKMGDAAGALAAATSTVVGALGRPLPAEPRNLIDAVASSTRRGNR